MLSISESIKQILSWDKNVIISFFCSPIPLQHHQKPFKIYLKLKNTLASCIKCRYFCRPDHKCDEGDIRAHNQSQLLQGELTAHIVVDIFIALKDIL